MEKNIFVKNKKYNPDIVSNYSKKLSERNNTKFKLKNQFSDSNIENNICDVDKPIDQIDLLIQKKIQERENQEINLKPEKNVVPSSNPNDFKEYNELKNQSTTYQQKNIKNNDNFNNILNDLQKLGIIKN
jgi:hypothetical protein